DRAERLLEQELQVAGRTKGRRRCWRRPLVCFDYQFQWSDHFLAKISFAALMASLGLRTLQSATSFFYPQITQTQNLCNQRNLWIKAANDVTMRGDDTTESDSIHFH